MTTDVSSRRLVRRTDDRIIAGVASGVADYIGIDPVLVRVFFVLTIFAGGLGLFAYAAIWFLAPEGRPDGPPATSRTDRNAGFWVAIVLFLMGGLALADNIADRSLVWPVLLIGAGVALWRSDASRRDVPPPGDVSPSPAHQLRTEIDQDLERDRALRQGGESQDAAPGHEDTAATAPPHEAPTAPSDEVIDAPHHQVGEHLRDAHHRMVAATTHASTAIATRRESAARRLRQRRSERDRSPLGGVTFAAMLVITGAMLLLDRLDVIAVAGSDIAATALLVLGVGLLVGSVAGRARWLVGPAIFAIVPVLVVTTTTENLGLDLTAGVGERQVAVQDATELESRYTYGIGEFILDLSDLEGSEGVETMRTEASLAVGQLTIVVPDDMTVVLDYDVALGATSLFREGDDGGPDLSGQRTFEGLAGGGRLELDATLGLGELVLLRDSAAMRPLSRN